jgi:hypothetical protein
MTDDFIPSRCLRVAASVCVKPGEGPRRTFGGPAALSVASAAVTSASAASSA